MSSNGQRMVLVELSLALSAYSVCSSCVAPSARTLTGYERAISSTCRTFSYSSLSLSSSLPSAVLCCLPLGGCGECPGSCDDRQQLDTHRPLPFQHGHYLHRLICFTRPGALLSHPLLNPGTTYLPDGDDDSPRKELDTKPPRCKYSRATSAIRQKNSAPAKCFSLVHLKKAAAAPRIPMTAKTDTMTGTFIA